MQQINQNKGRVRVKTATFVSLEEALQRYHHIFEEIFETTLSKNKEHVDQFLLRETKLKYSEFVRPQDPSLWYLTDNLFFLQGNVALELKKQEEALEYFKVCTLFPLHLR